MNIFKKAIKITIIEQCIHAFFNNFRKIFYVGIDDDILKLLNANISSLLIKDVNCGKFQCSFIHVIQPRISLSDNYSTLEIKGVSRDDIELSVINYGNIDSLSSIKPVTIRIPVKYITMVRENVLNYALDSLNMFSISLSKDNFVNINVNDFQEIFYEDDY